MRILAVSLTRPGHVLHTVVDWWKARGNEVGDIRLPAGYVRELAGWKLPSGKFDLAITAEPLSLLRLSTTSRISKLVFWRIDLREDFSHKAMDKLCIGRADEVWSITDESERGTYVPAMLGPEDIIQVPYETRQNVAIWAGPSLDGGLDLVRGIINLPLICTNWKSPLSDSELRRQLSSCKIGLALYDPKKRMKLHSDPFRVKKYLGAGLPVIMSGGFPFAWEVAQSRAGVCCEFDSDYIKRGIDYCLWEGEKMSENAYRLAEKFLISERWVKTG